jgi:hypothetical protein
MIADRQDIDALLIGALYGELTLADEARLTAHLESHPTDRSALANLTSAREAVRASRIFQVQLDPPQAVSALLLQEAARRAPRHVPIRDDRSESWFQRFTRSFMAHPAMAAAAMLVLVVGIAGTMYMRTGDQFADKGAVVAQQAPVPPAAADHGLATITASTAGKADKGGDVSPVVANVRQDEARDPKAAAGSAYRVDLDGSVDDNKLKGDSLQAALSKDAVHESHERKKGIEVRTEDTAPRELEGYKPQVVVKPPAAKVTVATPKEEQKQQIADGEVARGNSFGNGSGNANANNGVPGGGAPAQAPAHTAPPPPPPADRPADKVTDATTLAMAKDWHARAKAAVRASNCADAAKLVAQISTSAPEYYRDSVATDRDLKPCSAYIQNAQINEAEKTAKSRAQKRNSPDESPAPTQNMK